MQTGEFRAAPANVRGPQITTAEMIRMEREIVSVMRHGNERDFRHPMLLQGRERFDTVKRHAELNASRRKTAEELFASREKIVAIDGVAGAGKTTPLFVVREGAEAEGYRVEGFAPTSCAAKKLGEAGIETSTLQMLLARGQKSDTGEKRLYVVDESSLASTKQMHEFVTRLHPNDRVLLVGDRRQHEAVEAGTPFAQLQKAGMKTISLDQIVRQKKAELRNVVEQLARGEVAEAVKSLENQGRVHEFRGRDERLDAIAKEYAKSPENTLVVSPDNRSRAEINGRIHAELQERGLVSREEHRITTLVPRQDLTGAARTGAERYEVGSVLRYKRWPTAELRSTPAVGCVGIPRNEESSREDRARSGSEDDQDADRQSSRREAGGGAEADSVVFGCACGDGDRADAGGRRVHGAGSGQAGESGAQGAHGPEPCDRRVDQDRCEDDGKVPYR